MGGQFQFAVSQKRVIIHKYDIISLFRPFSLELSERRAIICESFVRKN